MDPAKPHDRSYATGGVGVGSRGEGDSKQGTGISRQLQESQVDHP